MRTDEETSHEQGEKSHLKISGINKEKNIKLEVIPGVDAIDVSLYETSYEQKVDAALHAHDTALELQRLDRVRKNIKNLRERIDDNGSKLSIARLAKLMDRVEELEAEEQLVLQRIEAASKLQLVERQPKLVANLENVVEKIPIIKRPKTLSTTKTIETLKKISEDNDKKSKEKRYTQEKDSSSSEEEIEDEELPNSFCDDGDTNYFSRRIQEWLSTNSNFQSTTIDTFDLPMSKQDINFDPLIPIISTTLSSSSYSAPGSLWSQLLDYQREGVQWMLNLYNQELGGILGDEMGLGKTLQVIALVATLQVCDRLHYPVLVVCPATVMKQWVSEFHQWWPPLRVPLLHRAGAAGNDDKTLEMVLKKTLVAGHVIVTSYGHLQHHKIGKQLLKHKYSMIILDEGHKIRNPNADITKKCKQLQSTSRFILSGTPIQNNLVELWSLMDFVYPGRLGLLPIFKAEIAVPINTGGYVNASSVQVQTAYKCACMLKDLIAPYLLRRLKSDVALLNLPIKREQVLFCHLTEYQRALYEHYVASEDVQAIMAGSKNILAGIDILRKICNHPTLLKLEEGEYQLRHELADLKVPRDPHEISGKINVLQSVLRHWYDEGGHKILLFCQTRQMLDIVEDCVQTEGYLYLRMDGTTPVPSRSSLVQTFNSLKSRYFIFLLTTRVGGLGINLTGADRVIIYDPDWNPSTDVQARERAWRLGQTKSVVIYRMLTVGTIEEKIYHRQIFKQYLTNRVLADPKQTRFFKASDLYDLFSLGNDTTLGISETKALLEGHHPKTTQHNEDKAPQHDDKAPSTPKLHYNETNLLEGLMQVTGLHSALEHDHLVEKPKREILLVEKEAERRASDALRIIKQSSARRNIFQSNKMMNGASGITTASILASIQRRRAFEAEATAESMEDSERQTIATTLAPNLDDSDLIKLVDGLLGLFRSHNGKCTSGVIANAFAHVSGDNAIAFRQVLKAVATLGQGQWTLKPEFLTY